MGGTSGFLNAPVAPAMPTPLVRIVKNAPPNPSVSDAIEVPPNDGAGGFIDAGGQPLQWLNAVAVTVQVDDRLLDPAFDLEVQLWRWKGRVGSRKSAGWAATAESDPFASVSNSGSHMLGGNATDVVSASRRTRQKVTSQGQRLAFNVGGFFRRGLLAFTEGSSSGPGSPVQATLSDVLLSLPFDKAFTVANSVDRNVSPWGRRRLTGLFAFSFSIADSSGRTDGRIFGPRSPAVAAGSSTHPFKIDTPTSNAFGFSVCEINPNYVSALGRHWWAERQSEFS